MVGYHSSNDALGEHPPKHAAAFADIHATRPQQPLFSKQTKLHCTWDKSHLTIPTQQQAQQQQRSSDRTAINSAAADGLTATCNMQPAISSTNQSTAVLR
jgi:hypothetical protein